VRDGVEALDYLFGRGQYAGRDLQEMPALLLLDRNLPNLGSADVLKAIRSDERTRHLPVVVLTAQDEEKGWSSACGHLVNSYAIKPVNFNEFVTVIRQLGSDWLGLTASPSR
jgi:two-component system response regulator